MSIRLGAYEIFSRIVPGGLYIAAACHLLVILGLLKIDLAFINDLSLVISIGLLLGAYTIGGAFDRPALAWFRIFVKRGIHLRIFTKFAQSLRARWQVEFTGDDWPILLALIRTRDLELAAEIDRHNAVSIMLRSVSLGLMLLGANSLIQALLTRQWAYLLVMLGMVGISLLVIKEALKFREMFYETIYQTILAYRIDLEAIVRPIKSRKVK